MSTKILITYATRTGSTAEVAATMAEILRTRGFEVDVKPIKEKPAVENYQAVIVGSAIRMGRWLPEAVEFLKSNRWQLREIPTAFFTIHMLNRDDSESSRQARQAYTASLHEILKPVDEVFFEGSMDYSKLNFLDRTIARAVEKQTNSKEGDFRDWNKIRGWAQTVLPGRTS